MPEPTAPDIQPGKGGATAPPVSPRPEAVAPGLPSVARLERGVPQAASPNSEVRSATPETAKPRTLEEAVEEKLQNIKDVPFNRRFLDKFRALFKRDETSDGHVDPERLDKWLKEHSSEVIERAYVGHPELSDFRSITHAVREKLVERAIKEGLSPLTAEMLMSDEKIKEQVDKHKQEYLQYKAAYEADRRQAAEGISQNGKETTQVEQESVAEEATTLQQDDDDELDPLAANIPPVQRIDDLSIINDPGARRILKFYYGAVDEAAGEKKMGGRGIVGSYVVQETIRQLRERAAQTDFPDQDMRILEQLLPQLNRQASILHTVENPHLTRSSVEYKAGEAIGTVRNDQTGKKVQTHELFFDKAARDKVFNDLFRIVDSTPHEFFREAFNPLTQGQRYEYFIDTMLFAFTDAKNDIDSRDARFVKAGLELYKEQKIKERERINTRRTTEGKPQLEQYSEEDLAEQFFVEIRRDYDRYLKERHLRENLHNASAFLYRTVIDPEQLYNYIKEFSGQMADIANRTPGVRKMLDIYEQQLRQAMLEHGGYLRPEDVIGKTKEETIYEVGEDGQEHPVDVKAPIERPVVEERAKKQFKKLYDQGLIYLRTETGETIDMREARRDKVTRKIRELETWELDRLITTTRGLMLANQRLLSLAAESKLTNAAQFGSYFLQDVLQAYSPNLHLDKKFFVPGVKSLGFMLNEPDRKKWGLTGFKIKVPIPVPNPGRKGWTKLVPVRWHETTPLAFRRPWSVSEYYARFTEYKDGYNSVGYGLKHPRVEFNRQNPNRAGDAFTWLYSWKVGEKPTSVNNESFTRDFLAKGYRNMAKKHIEEHYRVENGNTIDEIHADYWRIRQESGINNPDSMPLSEKARGVGYATGQKITYEELATPLKGVKYVNLDKKEGTSIDEDIVAINAYIMKHGLGEYESMNWKTVHDKVGHFRDELNEYENWIGTGIKFERMRSDIDYGKPEKKAKAIERAKKLLPRIVDLQPDKIFLKSEHVQDRVMKQLRTEWDADCMKEGVFSEEVFQEKLRETLENLNMMQEDLYKKRDKRVLEEGKSFYGHGEDHHGRVELDLDLIYDPHAGPDGTPPPAPIGPDGRDLEMPKEYQAHVEAFESKKKQRTRVEQFMQIMKDDFEQYKEKGTVIDGKPSIGYLDEFITNREFYHGFCLWSGDAPVDEFKMEAVGQTGAFARAAGDNLAAKKGAEATNQLMSNLKTIRVPEDSYEYLKEIYSAVLTHDGDLASKRMTEVAMMLMQWYGADWKASIPIVGGVQKWFGRSSMAQRAYGKRMPVWHAAEKRHLINFMKEKGYINDQQYDDLAKRGAARYFREVLADNLISISQILALVIAFYILKKSLEKE